MKGAISVKWVLTDHICRQCFGRVLQRSRPERGRDAHAFRCSCCGVQDIGESAPVICCCGLTLEGTKDMGVRCQVNEARSSESNTEIVAMVQGAQS